MTPSTPFKKRGSLVFASGLCLAATGLAWSITALADQPEKAKVAVTVDDKPIVRVEGDGTSFSPVVKRVAPSVVKVKVTARAKNAPGAEIPPFFNDPFFRHFFGDPFEQQQPRPGNPRGRAPQRRLPPEEGMGSGVIVSKDGYILTNNHVVNGADEILISLADGRELNAKVVGADPKTDLAVIKVDAKDLPAITFADSEKVEVGDRVLAIGNPFGIGQTVTSGMVSALGRATLGLDYEDFIQTDAAINPGNSGGALVDVKGRLVGINTAILSRTGGFQGIGFAIPSSLAKNVMEQLVQHGKVARGYIGVSIQDISPELAEAFKLQQRTGALVGDVNPGSPADKSGLRTGDVITKLNDKPIEDSRRLKLAVGGISPGSEVTLQINRDGKTQDLKVKVGEPPSDRSIARKSSPKDDEGTLNGVGVGDIDAETRRQFDLPANLKGAVVTEVDPASAAAAAGLQPGDVIQEINRKPVRSADEAVQMTEKAESKKTLLLVWSQRGAQRGNRYVIVDESTPRPDAS